MKLAICDDMEMYLKMIKEKIDSCLPDGPHGIDEFSSGEELLENFEKGKYDAAILDMHMKKLNGLQTAEKIFEIDNDIIIAFHTNDDYLHSKNMIMKKGQSDIRYYDQFQIIYDEYRKRNTVFKCEYGSFKVKEIIYFHKKFRHIVMHTQSKKYKLKMSLNNIDLPKFLRINNNCFVNLLFVKEINMQNVILKNGMIFQRK